MAKRLTADTSSMESLGLDHYSAQAKTLQPIVDAGSHASAQRIWKAGKELLRKIDDHFSVTLKAIAVLEASVRDHKRSTRQPVEEVVAAIGNDILDYEERVRRRQEEEAAAALALAEASREADLAAIEADAARAIAEGDVMRATALGLGVAALQRAPLDIAPVAAPGLATVDGVQTRHYQSAEVEDEQAFIDGVVSGQIPKDLIVPNLPALRALAKSMGKDIERYPGVRYISEPRKAG